MDDMNQELQTNYGEALQRNRAVVEEGLTVEDFVPFPGRILVQPLPEDTEIRGIFLPPDARQKKAIGHVRRVNPGDETFREGDLILFAVESGDEVTIRGTEYKVLMYNTEMDEGDILGHWPGHLIAHLFRENPLDPATAEAHT